MLDLSGRVFICLLRETLVAPEHEVAESDLVVASLAEDGHAIVQDL